MSTLLDQSKQSIETVKDQGVNKQVELKVKALDEVHDNTTVQPISDDVHDSNDEVNPPQQQQQYSIAAGRERRQIRLRFGSCFLCLWLRLLRIRNLLVIMKLSLIIIRFSGMLL